MLVELNLSNFFVFSPETPAVLSMRTTEELSEWLKKSSKRTRINYWNRLVQKNPDHFVWNDNIKNAVEEPLLRSVVLFDIVGSGAYCIPSAFEILRKVVSGETDAKELDSRCYDRWAYDKTSYSPIRFKIEAACDGHIYEYTLEMNKEGFRYSSLTRDKEVLVNSSYKYYTPLFSCKDQEKVAPFYNWLVANDTVLSQSTIDAIEDNTNSIIGWKKDTKTKFDSLAERSAGMKYNGNDDLELRAFLVEFQTAFMKALQKKSGFIISQINYQYQLSLALLELLTKIRPEDSAQYLFYTHQTKMFRLKHHFRPDQIYFPDTKEKKTELISLIQYADSMDIWNSKDPNKNSEGTYLSGCYVSQEIQTDYSAYSGLIDEIVKMCGTIKH